MKIAYTSDLHLDHHIKNPHSLDKMAFKSAFSEYFQELDSDTIIIAGDISHYPFQSVGFFKYLKTLGIKNIIVVLGNHEGYLIDEDQRSLYADGLDKIAFQRKLFRDNGVIVLDGDSVEINGVTIGGANGFYSGALFYRKMANSMYASNSLDSYWKSYMNDSRMMKLPDFSDYAHQEHLKFKSLRNQCDVMVSHIKPIIADKYFHPMYRGDLSNTFYSFDFEDDIIEDSKLRYWVYGHTHLLEEFNVANVKLVCNPYGYPSETKNKTIQHIEV